MSDVCLRELVFSGSLVTLFAIAVTRGMVQQGDVHPRAADAFSSVAGGTACGLFIAVMRFAGNSSATVLAGLVVTIVLAGLLGRPQQFLQRALFGLAGYVIGVLFSLILAGLIGDPFVQRVAGALDGTLGRLARALGLGCA